MVLARIPRTRTPRGIPTPRPTLVPVERPADVSVAPDNGEAVEEVAEEGVCDGELVVDVLPDVGIVVDVFMAVEVDNDKVVDTEEDEVLDMVLMILIVELGKLETMAPVLSKKTPLRSLQHRTSLLQQ
jgi:hypothetical protein